MAIIQEKAHKAFRSSSYIIRSDGSFLDNQSLAGIGWTINYQNLKLFVCGAAPVRTTSIIHTTFFHPCRASWSISKKSQTNDCLYRFLDNKSIINQYFNGTSVIPPSLNPIIQECQSLLDKLARQINWIPGEFISGPDKLAREARTSATSNFLEHDFPCWIVDLNCCDNSFIAEGFLPECLFIKKNKKNSCLPFFSNQHWWYG